MENFKRKVGEPEDAYIYRICSDKSSIGTWEDVASLLNAELEHNWTESAYRKKYQAGINYIITNQDELFNSEGYLQKIKDERDALEKERYKLATEKLERNRWLREEARDELFQEKVLEAIDRNVGNSKPPCRLQLKRDERCGILALADMHFGADFKIYGINEETLNEYSPEIFFFTMEKLFTELLDYIALQRLDYLKIFNLGDSLDGFLRHSQIWTLRYGVVDSAIILGDYLANWLRELSRHVGIEYYQTNGNHGELRLLDGRKGAHTHENIEKIVEDIIERENKDNCNLEIVRNKSGFIFTEAVGFNILGIHGEVKKLTDAIKDYTDIYDTRIDYLIAGHKHHTEFTNCGTRKGCIGVGSIIGSDDYSLSLRKTADATASLVIFEKNKGKTDEHTFVLN
ncbi:hypothetical protein M2140_000121 [Clostridiales Family XIII bacterium PM5-7]